jgi:hypothetical protein
MTMVSPGIRWKKDDENIERNQEQDNIRTVYYQVLLVLVLLRQDVLSMAAFNFASAVTIKF